MPPALKPHWESVSSSFTPNLTPLREALAREIPDKNDRLLALFSWFGSGAGPWSGFPSYETVAEKLLLEYSTSELLDAIEGKGLTLAQTEGVARLFGGWDFSRRRPNDRQLLPTDLKAHLLEHSLTSSDQDKRHRALRAFSER